jgi:hypothetical protein
LVGALHLRPALGAWERRSWCWGSLWSSSRSRWADKVYRPEPSRISSATAPGVRRCQYSESWLWMLPHRPVPIGLALAPHHSAGFLTTGAIGCCRMSWRPRRLGSHGAGGIAYASIVGIVVDEPQWPAVLTTQAGVWPAVFFLDPCTLDRYGETVAERLLPLECPLAGITAQQRRTFKEANPPDADRVHMRRIDRRLSLIPNEASFLVYTADGKMSAIQERRRAWARML